MDLINTALNISIKVINSSETRNDGEFAGVPQGPGLGHSGFFVCVCVYERRKGGKEREGPRQTRPSVAFTLGEMAAGRNRGYERKGVARVTRMPGTFNWVTASATFPTPPPL